MTAGISGLTDRDADAGRLLALVRDTGVRSATLAHDSTTSFLGALGDARGAVVAAGTGVVTLAVGRDAVARVDGWGYIMGDAGSGYWIGREALDAVMRAYDGRGPATALTDPVRERWPELPEAYIDLQAAEDRVQIVASFAVEVARLAMEGDSVSQAITERAAAELALSVTTSLRRVGARRRARRRVRDRRRVPLRAPARRVRRGAHGRRHESGCLGGRAARRRDRRSPRTRRLPPEHPLSSAVYRASRLAGAAARRKATEADAAASAHPCSSASVHAGESDAAMTPLKVFEGRMTPSTASVGTVVAADVDR